MILLFILLGIVECSKALSLSLVPLTIIAITQRVLNKCMHVYVEG